MADPDPRTFRVLGESRTEGPYSVVDATLATADLDLLAGADLLGATGPYSWRAFELVSERYDLPAFTEEGVDADGPYRLVDLSTYRLGVQDARGYLVQAHSTQAYRNEQFVGSAITFPRLAAMLRSYAADGRLEPGTAQSLLVKVEAASAAAERGQPNTTANQLAAFVRELEALPGDKPSEQTRASPIQAARRLGGL